METTGISPGIAAEKGYDGQLDFFFSFLPEGLYKATICRDGINADRNAMDYTIEKKNITSSSHLNLHMAPDGGFVIRLLRE